MRRSEELRRTHRRILLVAMGVAAMAHVALYFALRDVTIEIPPPGEVVAGPGLELLFGKPHILSVDGAPTPDTATHTLIVMNYGTARGSFLRAWPKAYQRYGEPGSASLRLVLEPGGRVVEVAVAESSGDPGKDSAFVAIARTVGFQWVPTSQVDGRVELVQPILVRPNY